MGSSGEWSVHRFQRWLYRGGRPSRLARVLNRQSAFLFAHNRFAGRTATLEIAGRVTGRTVSFPMVVTAHGGERFVVSMLGENTNWVRNLRAADGRAVLRHGRREEVRLVEVPPAERTPILRAYLRVAPGARPHIPVDRQAPDAEFTRVAPRFPVFRVEPVRGS